ncbi:MULTISPECIES: VOC family protein [unclassified Enterococcus]|uniref:VOC family protein n=1 Tax=unclassified Enterococcus TaxID=2608891 RepID=UPI00155198A6|nr:MULTISPECIES: VOC family protein [unclassified Enterococcus]MBS7578332.1 VOC family protein [Enterococcus sp. MMGLQ5-2]MBS7585569.1 VOC family protein [Enterococcus sp. MMGLQ5-1]NPD13428.1 VOC family protein [Enterococcus sp. MMGLQ5-1]NPD38163.1 VOC family protein [Enterococcus sp. MMGLQ5-2]
MKIKAFAIFLSLNGKAEAAIQFYQKVFNGKLLFKITNQEFKQKLNPEMDIPTGHEHYISHSVLQIGESQLQIADNPIYQQMAFQKGNTISLSVLTDDVESAAAIYQQIIQYPDSQIIQAPIENDFADFSAAIIDPFGVLIQINKEKPFEN